MALSTLLRRDLGPYARLITLVVGLQAVQATASLVLPSINARIIDQGVLTGDVGYIRRQGALMLAFALLQGLFAAGAMWVGARVAMGFGRDLRAAIFHRVTSFSAREMGAFGAPSLITRVTNDVQQIQMLVVMTTTMATAAPMTIVVGTVLAMRQDLGLSVILAVAIPLTSLVLGVIVARMVPAFQQMQERIDNMNRVLREQLSGLRVIRAFVREPQETERFVEANAELYEVGGRAGRQMAAMFPIVNLLVNLSGVAVLWLGADRLIDGDVQLGTLVAYLTYLVLILWSVVMATFTVSMIPRAAVAASRIEEVLATEPSVAPPTDPVVALTSPGHLDLRDVGFHYPGAEHAVLSGITFSTPPGTTTAIVGSTGAGKTTLVNLVPRLFDATTGAVMVGGIDVREVDPALLARTVAIVPQRAYLFSGTVASNLRYGRPDATDDELWEALRIAQADEFVAAMPGGLDAPVEQGGSNVSGGQRQRLSIARALVRQPGIYVFDDAFSALDLATDARLRAELVPYTRDSAVVIVAQRVSTIAGADQIVVLDDGEIVGVGTHEQLLVDCPTYAEIVESQVGERAA